jgi:hypothetical protein
MRPSMPEQGRVVYRLVKQSHRHLYLYLALLIVAWHDGNRLLIVPYDHQECRIKNIYPNPISRAYNAACVRSRKPSLERILLMWFLTVPSVI